MRGDDLKHLLWNRHAASMGGLLLVQQITVASSTAFLTLIARNAAEGRLSAPIVAAYLFSVIFPYVPGGLALIAQRKWELQMYGLFLARGSAFLYGRPALFSSRDDRDRYTGLYAKESFAILGGVSAWVYGVCASSLNVALSILALALVVEPRFLLGYAISLVLAAKLLRFQAPRNERLATEAQRQRVTLASALLQVWDNAVLGNRSSFERWSGDVTGRFDGMRTSTLLEVRFATLVSISIAMVTLFPTIGVLAWAVLRHRHETPYLIALIVTLPRLFQILNTSYSLLALLSEWSAQRGRLVVLLEFFVPPPPPELAKRLKLGAIHATTIASPLTVDRLEAALAGPGRITVRGPNGSGKSTLLLILKERLGDRAFYLPAHHRLRFITSADPASTGEAAGRIIEELARCETSEVVLLDEWDANLDGANRRRLSGLIDEIARTRAVVEVRHAALAPDSGEHDL